MSRDSLIDQDWEQLASRVSALRTPVNDFELSRLRSRVSAATRSQVSRAPVFRWLALAATLLVGIVALGVLNGADRPILVQGDEATAIRLARQNGNVIIHFGEPERAHRVTMSSDPTGERDAVVEVARGSFLDPHAKPAPGSAVFYRVD